MPSSAWLEVVAVVHPYARVVGTERHLPDLARAHVERVQPQWTAGWRAPVAGEDQHVVAVQVPRVGIAAAVDDGEASTSRPSRTTWVGMSGNA